MRWPSWIKKGLFLTDIPPPLLNEASSGDHKIRNGSFVILHWPTSFLWTMFYNCEEKSSHFLLIINEIDFFFLFFNLWMNMCQLHVYHISSYHFIFCKKKSSCVENYSFIFFVYVKILFLNLRLSGEFIYNSDFRFNVFLTRILANTFFPFFQVFRTLV